MDKRLNVTMLIETSAHITLRSSFIRQVGWKNGRVTCIYIIYNHVQCKGKTMTSIYQMNYSGVTINDLCHQFLKLICKHEIILFSCCTTVPIYIETSLMYRVSSVHIHTFICSTILNSIFFFPFFIELCIRHLLTTKFAH